MQTPRPLTEAATAEYGGEVGPKPPQQDMYQVDVLAGGPVAGSHRQSRRLHRRRQGCRSRGRGKPA